MKLIFWGTGNVASKFIKQHRAFMQMADVVGFTDKDMGKCAEPFNGYFTSCPDLMLKRTYDYILILSGYFEEIRMNLMEQYAVPSEKILSIDDAYQMYIKIVYKMEKGIRYEMKEFPPEFAFSEKIYDRMLEGTNNMFWYLYIQDKFKESLEKFREELKYQMPQDWSQFVEKKDMPVWICWLQGLENAPDIVKCCINSIVSNIEGKVHIITYDNYAEYIEISEYVLEKHRRGIITKTIFSDMIRLALLCKYGGIWIDATMLMMRKGLPDYIYETPVFMYKVRETLDRGYLDPRLFTNWFIKSNRDHPVFNLVYRLQEKWWETEDKLPYCLFHYIMRLTWNVYESECSGKNRLILYDNNCRVLVKLLNEVYDTHLWNMIKAEQPLQKLTYKMNFKNGDSFYEYILEHYGKGPVCFVR